MKNIETKKYKKLLAVLFIIFITDSLMFATNAQYMFIAFKRFSVVLVALIMLLNKVYRGNNKYNIDIVFLTISIIISMFLAGEIVGYMYFTQIACLIFAICYSQLVSQEEFAEDFVKIMRIIAIVSLIGFVIPSVIASLPLPTLYNRSDYSFKTLFLTNIPLQSVMQKRNFGPFWEPGAYQFYLNIAFYFSLFVTKNKRPFDIILFAVTCITTKSGASFIGLGFIFIAYMIAHRNEEDKIKRFIIPAVLFIVVYMLYNPQFYRTFEKVFNGLNSEDNVSFGYRLAAVITYVKATFIRPFFGNSAEVLEQMMGEEMDKLIGISGGGNTNTVLSFFAYFGVFIGGYIVKRIYVTVRQNSSSVWVAWLLFAAIVATTSNENFTCSLLFCVFIFLQNGNKNSLDKVDTINESSVNKLYY